MGLKKGENSCLGLPALPDQARRLLQMRRYVLVLRLHREARGGLERRKVLRSKRNHQSSICSAFNPKSNVVDQSKRVACSGQIATPC